MNLDQLETFVQVARTRSFSRAAVLLYLAQPTLSGRIAALEAELGTRRFVLHDHTLEPSEASRTRLPCAQRNRPLRLVCTTAVQASAHRVFTRPHPCPNP